MKSSHKLREILIELFYFIVNSPKGKRADELTYLLALKFFSCEINIVVCC